MIEDTGVIPAEFLAIIVRHFFLTGMVEAALESVREEKGQDNEQPNA
jgi:hypothetical protein